MANRVHDRSFAPGGQDPPGGLATAANQVIEIAKLTALLAMDLFTAAVKPANTEPTTSDKALVVSLSPNSNSLAEVTVKYDQDSYIPNFTAFSRLRTAEPLNIFDCKQLVDKAPLFFDDQQTSGGGTTSTYNTNQSSTTIAVSNLTAGARVRQTFQSFPYQPGKSQLIFLTGIIGSIKAGIKGRIGLFNTNNGLFFESGPTTFGIVVRSFTSGVAVDTKVDQANFNIDKLDGTGLSGITIDLTKVQIFVIDFQWLGTGRVRFGVDIGGVIIYCHQVLTANIGTTVYMQIPNLPVRYSITNDGTGPAASLTHICCSVISEGGQQDTGTVFSADRGTTVMQTLNNTSIYPVVSLRLKSTVQMADINLLMASYTCSSNCVYRWVLLLNPTIVGTALSFVSIANSALEFDGTSLNGTTVTGGTQISSGYALSTVGNTSITVPSNLRLGANIAGVSDILVLGVQRVTGTAESFLTSAMWRELL